jgi:hypothetical protein
VEHLPLALPLSIDERPDAGADGLRANHVDHVELPAAADELGGMDECALGRVRSIEADEDPHGRW